MANFEITPEEVTLAMSLAQLAASLFTRIKSQSGMTDEQILDAAGVADGAARDAAKKFLATLA